jgi:hypothetical protein
MQAIRVTTGPFILEYIDNTDSNYLKLHFSDGRVRLIAKGGRWPSHVAANLALKAENLLNKSVYIVTSQTTKDWETREWLCDIVNY